MKQCPEKSGASQAREKFVHFCKKRRTLMLCCLLSVVAHTPLLTTENQIQTASEVWDQMPVIRERIEMFFKQSFRNASKMEYLAQLEGQPADKVELGNFFLETEYNEGLTDYDEVEEGREKLNQLIQSFKELASKEKDKLKVLRELIKQHGTHEEGESSLNSILINGTGNCEARAKLAVSILQETYPDMPVKLQHYRDHMRAIAQVEGKWYALEGSAPKPVEKKDLQSTIITDPSAFVSSYIGRNFGANKIGLKPNPKRAKIRITNTYFNLLSGVDKSKLIDAADAPISMPKKLQKPLPDLKKAQATIKIPTFGKSRGRRPDKQKDAPIRIEIFTEKEMERLFNKPKKKKRKQQSFKWTDEIIASAAQKKSFKSHHTNLDDLQPLKGAQIENIDIRGTNVAELSPLQGMPIEHINLNDTNVADLSPLRGMPLKSIWLTGTDVTDLTPLKESGSIKVIDFSGTEVSDLTPLGAMYLWRIDLDSTKVTDLSPLSGIPVRFIDISNTDVVDLSPLQGMTMIKRIFLSNTGISDLSSLKGIPIENIDLSHTDVSDLSPLKGMPIGRINLSGTNVTDLSPLMGMPLAAIDTSNTNVSDLSPVLGSNAIFSLNIKGTKVEEITFLKKRRVSQFSSDFSSQEVNQYRMEYNKSRRAKNRHR